MPPSYARAPAGSKADPFKEWICELPATDPSIQSLRLRELANELGYAGGKSIFDDCDGVADPSVARKRWLLCSAADGSDASGGAFVLTTSSRSPCWYPGR